MACVGANPDDGRPAAQSTVRSLPPAVPIVVRAPIYEISSGLKSDEFASAQTARPGTASSITYDAETVRQVVELGPRCE